MIKNFDTIVWYYYGILYAFLNFLVCAYISWAQNTENSRKGEFCYKLNLNNKQITYIQPLYYKTFQKYPPKKQMTVRGRVHNNTKRKNEMKENGTR